MKMTFMTRQERKVKVIYYRFSIVGPSSARIHRFSLLAKSNSTVVNKHWRKSIDRRRNVYRNNRGNNRGDNRIYKVYIQILIFLAHPFLQS